MRRESALATLATRCTLLFESLMTITPTRRRGLRATMTRSADACADALRLIVRLPA